MKRTLPAIAGLCAGLSVLAAPALAGPDHEKNAKDTHAQKDTLTLEEIVGEVELPELFIGSKAPELQLATFVKGDSVEQFEEGKTYVVEFWATWCGPCIAAFPHLSELQSKHADDLQVIGVNIWERSFPDQASRIAGIEEFVADQGERMGYSVAVEDGTAMADTWMIPAGQNGIPAAFIVDGTGTVAWIGHPMAMDGPLESIIAGDFDATEAIENYKAQTRVGMAFELFAKNIEQEGDNDRAMLIAELLMSQSPEDIGTMYRLSSTILNTENPQLGEAAYSAAHDMATGACEATEWKDWFLLSNYAKSVHKLGDDAKAAEWQAKAIEAMPEQYQPRYLEMFEADLAIYKGEG